jgi:hypothetical protein
LRRALQAFITSITKNNFIQTFNLDIMKKDIILLIALIIVSVVNCNAQWQLTGNSISGTDFLGSTNSQPLIIKVNNLRSGLIDYDGSTANTTFGYQILQANTTGHNNTGIGYTSLYSNTSGAHNAANGYNALYYNTSGSYNTGMGSFALYSNTTGIKNTAIGFSSLYANSSGNYNVASGLSALAFNSSGDNNVAYGSNSLKNNTSGAGNVAMGYQSLFTNTTVSNLTALGYEALYSNSSGTENTAVGYRSLYSNTSGIENTAMGHAAMYSNTTGQHNTAAGFNALYSNSTGFNNTAFGVQALENNTSGGFNVGIGPGALFANTIGIDNVAVGYSALATNTEGEDNTAIGQLALAVNETGLSNTAVGFISAWRNTTGGINTAVGYAALEQNMSGDANTGLGFAAGPNSAGYTNTTALGSGATTTASNQVRIGDAAVVSIGGYQNWTNISDGRIKRNIISNVPGLEFINRLKPVTYTLDLGEADKIVERPVSALARDERLNTYLNARSLARKAKEQMRLTGFIAQEVEAAAKSVDFDFSGVDVPKNDKDLYGLRYAEFVVPLVKAVQELSAQNDKLVDQNKQLQDQINTLSKKIDAVELSQRGSFNSNLPEARLDQNAPNPFSASTVIRYYVPTRSFSARIVIVDLNGRTVKSISINDRGAGQVTFAGSTFSAGNYVYSLIVDDKVVDTKQMTLTK